MFRFVFAAAFALIPLPSLAEEVTADFLEQEGKIWVSSDLPMAVHAGLIVPIIPYARFEDGQVETGFLSRMGFIYDAQCDDIMNCRTVTTMGADRRGAYVLEDGALTTDGPPLPDWVFDRPSPETNIAIATSTFFQAGRAVVRREGEALIQSRAEGTRTYEALPEAEIWDAQNLAVMFEVPFFRTYECTAQALTRFRAVPEAEHSADDADFAALLRVVRWQSELDMAIRALRTHDFTLDPETLPPAEAAALAQAEARSYLTSMIIAKMSQAMIEASADGTGPARPAEVSAVVWADMEQTRTALVARAPDPEAAVAEVARRLPDIGRTAHFFARYSLAQRDGADAYGALICGR